MREQHLASASMKGLCRCEDRAWTGYASEGRSPLTDALEEVGSAWNVQGQNLR